MKGILFKPWKIKAIAESSPDREWQTRRLTGLKEINEHPDEWILKALFSNGQYWFQHPSCERDRYLYNDYPKPNYQVGEVVYIKETLFRHPYLDEAGYVLDKIPVFINQTIGDCLKWRWPKDILSAMFMPQEAARDFIKITGVRAERVQDITPSDVTNEGLGWDENTLSIPNDSQMEQDLIRQYALLWDSINPKYPFKSNPWDWVYSFVRFDYV